MAWARRGSRCAFVSSVPTTSDELDRFLPALLSAEPDTMRRFLALLRREFGSVEGYIAHLGLTSAVGYLRAALLESSISER